MEEKLKIILFKIIYNKLNLDKIEKTFLSNGVKYKNISNPNNYEIVSKYFFLANELHLENLNSIQIDKLKYYVENSDLKNISMDFHSFLNEILLDLLLPKTNKKYINFDKEDFSKEAPADAIILKFHYIEFDYNDEDYEKIQDIVVDNLNYIQDYGEKIGLKVAVIRYNESLLNRRIRL